MRLENSEGAVGEVQHRRDRSRGVRDKTSDAVRQVSITATGRGSREMGSRETGSQGLRDRGGGWTICSCSTRNGRRDPPSPSFRVERRDRGGGSGEMRAYNK